MKSHIDDYSSLLFNVFNVLQGEKLLIKSYYKQLFVLYLMYFVLAKHWSKPQQLLQ